MPDEGDRRDGMWRKRPVEVERERKMEEIPSILRERRERPLLVTLTPIFSFFPPFYRLKLFQKERAAWLR
jgi:hypothetical protein